MVSIKISFRIRFWTKVRFRIKVWVRPGFRISFRIRITTRFRIKLCIMVRIRISFRISFRIRFQIRFFKLNFYFPGEDMPRVKVGSHNVSVDYGQDINLTCTASVFKYLIHLQITVAWLKDGRTLKRIKTSNSLHDFPFTLSLRKVSSAGSYLCWISVDNNHDSQKFEDNGTVFLTGKIPVTDIHTLIKFRFRNFSLKFCSSRYSQAVQNYLRQKPNWVTTKSASRNLGSPKQKLVRRT